MNGEIDGDKVDDVMLPGFRFHPTDEELVGFYLKRKIQHRTLPIELIKQVDIYKYDPWDLPNLACTEEKEWYFYCPRDRKYRNSARPNRVTVAGFWKATGTDRPIYSSNGTECIGLKKSLVFYRGRAAKGIKTDWMMHEFRLPSTSTSALPNKISDKNLPPNDSWAICRIFKKTNNMAQRALSHSWTSQIHETTASDIFNQGAHYNLFSPESISCTTETGSPIQLSSDFPLHCNSTASLSSLDIPSYKHTIPTVLKQYAFPFDLSHLEMSKSTVDVASMNFNISPVPNGDIGKTSESINFESPQQPINGGPIHSLLDSSAEVNVGSSKSPGMDCSNNEWGNMESVGFPFGLSSNVLDAWTPNFVWDSPPRPSEMSTTFSINHC